MELIYCHIENEKCIKDISLVFSNQFTVTKRGRKISIQKKGRGLGNIYGPICNILGIIGENGSGKTTIIECICRDLTSDVTSIYGTNSYLFFDQGENIFYLVSRSLTASCKGFDARVVSGENFIPIKVKREFSLLYYSPIFIPHQKDSYLSQQFVSMGKNLSNNLAYKSSNSVCVKNDIVEQFSFLQEYPALKGRDDFPKYFQLTFNRMHLNNLQGDLTAIISSLFDQDDLFARVDNMLSSFDDLHANEKMIEVLRFKSQGNIKLVKEFNLIITDLTKQLLGSRKGLNMQDALRNWRVQFLIRMIRTTRVNTKLFFVLFILRDELVNDFCRTEFEHVLFEVERRLGSNQTQENFHSRDLKQLFQIIKKMRDEWNETNEIMEKIKKQPLFFLEGRLPIKFTASDEGKVLLFQKEVFLKYKMERRGFELGWAGVSSGEIAKLSFYSRLFKMLGRVGFRDRTILLVLDEPDVYLHPEWQRIFIDDLISFLDTIKVGKQSFQLVITTHSPIMISDIEKESLTVLKKSKSKIVATNVKEQTFGSNIHSNYFNTFSLTSTKGQIFDRKIAEIYKAINGNNLIDHKTLDAFYDVILHTGDNIIKEAFLEKLFDISTRDCKSNQISLKKLREKIDTHIEK